MTKNVKVGWAKDKDGNDIIPFSHEDAVLTKDGGSISDKFKKFDLSLETKTDMTFGSTNRCAVAFVTDDGQLTDYTIFYKKIFELEDVPANNCLITNDINKSGMISWEQANELHNAGWSVCSHSNTHINISGKTEKEIDDDLRIAKEILKAYSLDHEYYVAPYGGYNTFVDRVARKYYKANWSTDYRFYNGCTTIDGKGKKNFVNNYRLPRRNGIGETLDGVAVTKQDMINDIIYAQNNNIPVVFCMHSHYKAFRDGDTGVKELREVIQYCKTNNIPIVNLREIDRLYSNKCDIGNINEDNIITRIDCTGNIFNNQDKLQTIDTSNDCMNKFVKIATIQNHSDSVDSIVKFNYSVGNLTDVIGGSGNVEINVRCNGNMSTTMPIVRIINKISDNTKQKAPEFYAVLLNQERFNQTLDIYVKINKKYSKLYIDSFRLVNDIQKSFAELSPNNVFVDVLPSNLGEYTQISSTLSPFKYDKVPDFTPVALGQILVDSINKKAYISCGLVNNNDFKEITDGSSSQIKGSFAPIMKGGTTAGTPTYTEQMGEYIKDGNICNIFLKLVGTFDSTITGEISIGGLPFSSTCISTCNIGYQKFGLANGKGVVQAYLSSSSKTIYLNTLSDTGDSKSIQGAEVAGKNFTIWLQCTYQVA